METKHFILTTIIFFSLFSKLSAQDLFQKYSRADIYLSQESSGIKLFIPFYEVRFYQNQEDLLFGMNFNTEQIFRNYPCFIKAGNISAGGLYSKLKSPLLSSTLSPFSSISPESTSLTATLPSARTPANPASLALQLGRTSKSAPLRDLRLTWFSTPADNISVLSAKTKFALPVRSAGKSPVRSAGKSPVRPAGKFPAPLPADNPRTISFSACAGYFDYSSNPSNSWFVTEQYYRPGIHFCEINQFSFVSQNFGTTFYVAFYESPFADYQTVYRSESKLKTAHFSYNFSALYLPGTILTCSNDTYKNLCELKTGVQYQFVTVKKAPLFVRTGISTFCKINLEKPEQDFKFSTGFQLSSLFSSFSFSAATLISSKTSQELPSAQLSFNSASFQLKNSWYINNFTPSLSAGFSFDPNTDYTSLSTTQNYGLNLIYSPSAKLKITNNNKISLTQKDFQPSERSLSSSITGKFALKKLSLTCKLEFKKDLLTS